MNSRRNRPVPQDAATLLSSRFLTLRSIASDIFVGHWEDPLSKSSETAGVLTYRDSVPSVEPHRTQFLISTADQLCAQILTLLTQPRNTTVLIPGETLQVLFSILQDSPLRRKSSNFENPDSRKWRPKFQGFVASYLTIFLEHNPGIFARTAQEPLHDTVRLLQMKKDPRLSDLVDVYSAANSYFYGFLAAALNTPSTSDLFSGSVIRELAECIVSDNVKSSNLASLTCLTVLLQTQAQQLKTELKNKIFSCLILAIKSKIQIDSENRLSAGDYQLCGKLFTVLTTFILSTAVHIGILNIASGVFQEGLRINDIDARIVCRQGLQVVSTMLRPRVPLEVFENHAKMGEPATRQVVIPAAPKTSIKASNFSGCSGPSGVLTAPIVSKIIAAESVPATEETKGEGIKDVPKEKTPPRTDSAKTVTNIRPESPEFGVPRAASPTPTTSSGHSTAFKEKSPKKPLIIHHFTQLPAASKTLLNMDDEIRALESQGKQVKESETLEPTNSGGTGSSEMQELMDLIADFTDAEPDQDVEMSSCS